MLNSVLIDLVGSKEGGGFRLWFYRWICFSYFVNKRSSEGSLTAIGQRFTTVPLDLVILSSDLNPLACWIRCGNSGKIRHKLTANLSKSIISWVLNCTLANFGNRFVAHDLNYSPNLPRWRSILNFQIVEKGLPWWRWANSRTDVEDKIRPSKVAQRREEPGKLMGDDALSLAALQHVAKVLVVSKRLWWVYSGSWELSEGLVRKAWVGLWVGTAPSPFISPCCVAVRISTAIQSFTIIKIESRIRHSIVSWTDKSGRSPNQRGPGHRSEERRVGKECW